MFKAIAKALLPSEEVMAAAKEKYQAQNPQPTVKEIHAAFRGSGEALVAKERDKLAELEAALKQTELNEAISELGFVGEKSVETNREIARDIGYYKSSIAIYGKIRRAFPRRKLICDGPIMEICKKYNLIWVKDLQQYKGEIPKRNKEAILNFSRQVVESNAEWAEPYYHLEDVGEDMSIAAPRDMFGDLKNYEQEKSGAYVKKSPPDPIVFFNPKNLSSDTHVIVTAWGKEAQDARVLNENDN